MKKVLVSGCYDLLHAGHIEFFREASQHGQLYVRAGTDANIMELKGRAPMFSQEERLYVLRSIKWIHDADLCSGRGMLDFEPDMARLKPDIFIVNEDGHTPGKEALCRKYNVAYKVLKRTPAQGLPARSSSGTKQDLVVPYRTCLTGGWIDQPWVSEICPGSVVTVALEATYDFDDRCGMATSTRRVAEWLWGKQLPSTDYEKAAKILFACENPPGTTYVSGSQDAIGLIFPGINRLDYAGGYWPERIESCWDPEVARWLEGVLHFIPLAPRPAGYDPLLQKNLDPDPIRRLGEAGKLCWDSIMARDVAGLGRSLSETLRSWQEILPYTVSDEIMAEIDRYSDLPGANFSGAGGGFIIVASDDRVEGSFPIKVRLPRD